MTMKLFNFARLHAKLTHNVRFVAQVETLIDHRLQVTSARPLG
jgi:hypothetical protein